ncbi:3-phosphoserine/phosphohydroxythreonine transaminase [Suttonella ornithocola]|uniref:Phosphoserine aminotransferase n=1 Tax=Suttonella ornithocola TaxID=279832 RepID=A0A380MSV1_9GAMM|nr:3-phosphoserine/phosphohydroxythreonine transaminase [Suttonella ornithocola]SUO95625.1 Phosphoserine aminotransferase [Suttonella ornithocola]
MTHRIYNFCAGPCTLPLSVLEQAQAELLDFQGSGMSVMEISHRSKRFEPLHEETVELASKLIAAPDDFQCLFLPGGASEQFVMTAMNLLANGGKAAIANSGIWANKALIEARRIGEMEEIWSGESTQFTTLPSNDELKARLTDTQYKYLHLTSNETIGGIQYHELPTDLSTPLVIDASSDYYTRPISWQSCDIVYGGAQKNLAPSGFAVVFIRKALLQDHPHIPKFLTYKAHADANSLYNTPPTWQIYLLNGVLKWMQGKGGIPYFEAQAKQKSEKLYQAIDKSDFYQNNITPVFRSRTNVIFQTPNEQLDTEFWQTAEKEGLSGLKGHKLVGGIRASLYNALEISAADALIDFMNTFERTHG